MESKNSVKRQPVSLIMKHCIVEQDGGVSFSSYKAAEKYIIGQISSMVQEFDVQGKMEDKDHVFIVESVESKDSGEEWHIVGIYGNHDDANKAKRKDDDIVRLTKILND